MQFEGRNPFPTIDIFQRYAGADREVFLKAMASTADIHSIFRRRRDVGRGGMRGGQFHDCGCDPGLLRNTGCT